MAIDARFYVYEHWRPDTGDCFYVGKGYGDRAFRFRRNNYYNHIIKKLACAGLKPEVRIVMSGMDETSALAFEVERIAHWKSLGTRLSNITAGGEGVSGLKHNDLTRAKIREKRAKQTIVCSPDTRMKISLAQIGIPKSMERRLAQSRTMSGRRLSKEHRIAISEGLMGHSISCEGRANMSRAQRGHPVSDAARANMRAAHFGNRISSETRRRMSESQKARWANRRSTGDLS